PKRPLLPTRLAVQAGRETAVVRLTLTEVLRQLLQPRSHRKPCGAQFFLIDVDMELLLERVPEGGDPMVERDRLHGEHGILQHRKDRSVCTGMRNSPTRFEALAGEERGRSNFMGVKLVDFDR